MQRVSLPTNPKQPKDASDVSSATEAYAEMEMSEINNPSSQVADDVNLVNLIGDIERYLAELQNRPTTSHRKIAVIAPVLAWLIYICGLLFVSIQESRYTNLAGQYKADDPEYIKAAHLAHQYKEAATIVGGGGFIAIFGMTMLYYILLFNRLWNGKNIPSNDWNNILNNLQSNVLLKLQQLEAMEKQRNVPGTLLPIDIQSLRNLESTTYQLNFAQPRERIIGIFTRLLNSLQTLQSEINKTRRPLTVLFAHPQDDIEEGPKELENSLKND